MSIFFLWVSRIKQHAYKSIISFYGKNILPSPWNILNPLQKLVHGKDETRTPGYTRGGIRWLGGVSIPCWPDTQPWAKMDRVNGAISSQNQCIKTPELLSWNMSDSIWLNGRLYGQTRLLHRPWNMRSAAFKRDCWKFCNNLFVHVTSLPRLKNLSYACSSRIKWVVRHAHQLCMWWWYITTFLYEIVHPDLRLNSGRIDRWIPPFGYSMLSCIRLDAAL